MAEPEQNAKRPHVVLRALLSVWLLSWFIVILFFIRSMFDPQPIFGWGAGSIWLAVSIIGWLIVYRLLSKLRRLPPE